MNRFVEVLPLALTPLTPIHIGCGEDFEPTNYVIDGGILYHFEPTRLSLTPADRQCLIKCANEKADDAIRAIQSFFHERRAACRAASRLAVPVAAGVVEWYEGRIGRIAQREAGGRTVSNQLEIERTAHHPHTGTPYLPGSSLKGSMRTGWLNFIDNGSPTRREPDHPPSRGSVDLEANLLGGSFKSDPFRLIDVADAAGRDVPSRAVFAVDRPKRPRRDRDERLIERQNLFVRREAICGGQPQGLRGEIRFKKPPAYANPEKVPAVDKRISDFRALAHACNRFYLQRLRTDLQTLRALRSDPWIGTFENLIASFQPAFEDGRAMLLRVGRHSGAESITLERRRSILIRGGKHRESSWQSEATTIWLAAEREDEFTKLRPFGWVLVEPANNPPREDLKRWCEAETKTFAMTAAPESTIAEAGSLETTLSHETVWSRARLQYIVQNGTLAAIGLDLPPTLDHSGLENSASSDSRLAGIAG
jgi:CRISPR-associated protein Csm5